MDKLKDLLKMNGVVNKLRTEKWKRHVYSNLLPSKVTALLEKEPSRIHDVLHTHLKQFPDGGNSILEELEKVYKLSPLSKEQLIEEQIVKEDMLFCYFAYGFSFNEYVCYQFDKKGIDERITFLSDRDIAWICYDMNDMRKMSILADKAKTYSLFGTYFGREAIIISDKTDFERFLNFISLHNRFVCKITGESCGRGVELIDLAFVANSPSALFEKILAKGKTILEEVVVQSDTLGAINSSSVNTLRCISIKTKRNIEIPFVFLKAGRAGMFVDNGSAGGLLIAVDKNSGRLGEATDEYGNRFREHPDSGYVFNTLQLPDLDQAFNVCYEMSSKLPDVKIIGWDLAHTAKGWVVIEGNSMTESIGPQATQLKGIKKEMERLRSGS